MNGISGQSIIAKYTENRMSIRPEFYSGRGAIIGDLNSGLLEMIYQGVKQEYGDKAAAHFVQFVYDQKKLSATGFMNAFYVFVDYNNCEWKPQTVEHKAMDDVDVGPDNGHRLDIGVATMIGVFSHQTERDETEAIRAEFLMRHGNEFKPDPNRKMVGNMRYGKHMGYK